MKNFYRIIILLVVCFVVGCTDAIYDSSTTETQTTIIQSTSTVLIVKNMTTSFDIIKFTWGGRGWEYSVIPGESATLPVDAGTNYLYFSYCPKYGADPGKKIMECYVSELITVKEDEQKTFSFTDNTSIIQKDNTTNRATINTMSYPTDAQLTLSYDGRNVPRQDSIEVGTTAIGDNAIFSFSMKNTGTDKLIFMGNKPISIDNSTDKTVFAVTQPITSVLNADETMDFTVKFTPKEEKEYTTLITIATNENVGAFTFTITAIGAEPAPKFGIKFNNQTVSNDGTINFGDVAIDSSSTKEITITNTGTKKLLLTETPAVSFYGEANGFEIVSQPIPSISAGGSTTFRVKFTPTEVGEKSAILSIPNNDDDVYIDVKATGYKAWPAFTLTDASGDVSEGTTRTFADTIKNDETSTVTYTLTNTGLVDLNIADLTSDSEYFTISSPISVVKPNQAASIEVTFKPNGSVGTKTAKLTISTNCENTDFVFYAKATSYKIWPTFTLGTNNIAEGSTNLLTPSSTTLIRSDKTYSKSYTLRNTSTVDLHIIDLTSDSQYFTISSPMSVVLPDQTASITITFAPNGFVGKNITGGMKITTDCEDSEFVFYVKASSRALYTGALLTSAYFTGVESPYFSPTQFEYNVTYDSEIDLFYFAEGELVCSEGATIFVNDINLSEFPNHNFERYEGFQQVIRVVSEDGLTTNTYTCTYHPKDNFDNAEVAHLYISSTANGTKTDLVGQCELKSYKENGETYYYWDYDTNLSQFYVTIVPEASNAIISINNNIVSANKSLGPYTEVDVYINSESYQEYNDFYIH